MENYVWTKDSLNYENADHEVIAHIGYSMINDDHTYVIEHTWVSENMRGSGLAGKITSYFLDEVAKQDKDVLPLCPYTQKYFKRHPELSNLLHQN
ncbi:GNAT family N-acetyltransferase [Ligilactobacillus equi]